MYEAGISTSFRAQHIMPGMPGPEGELHDHDYRMEVVVARSALDQRGMVCDLDELQRVVGEVVGRVEGENLQTIQPAATEGVTVEILARWAHGEIAALLGAAGGESLSIRVWESPVAFGGYAAPLVASSS